MQEIFKTVLMLSLFGFCITLVLLLLKPLTAKKFPAKWQYYVWLAVLLSMVIPVYKMIPEKQVEMVADFTQTQFTDEAALPVTEPLETEAEIKDEPMQQQITEPSEKKYKIPFEFFSFIWLLGICLFLSVVISSYAFFIVRKRKNAVSIEESALLDDVKSELGIKRKIKLRMSPEISSPLLVGVFFPVIYLPLRDISDENMRMIFLHELTHYKRMDLGVKWISVFVNAIHWFNPFSYLLCANLSEACEVSCDMEVTKNMTEEQQRSYMKTILDLMEG